jgi:hypothetical protein
MLNNFKIKLGSLVLAASMLASPVVTAADDMYAGIDIMKLTATTKDKYGSNAYYKSPLAYGVSAGYKFDDNLFAEVGYEFTGNKERTNRIGAGDFLPGAILQGAGTFDVLKTKLKLQHLNAYFGYNFNMDDYLADVDLTLAAGLSLTKLKAQQEVLENEVGALNQAAIDASRRSFSKTKVVPTIKATAGYKLNENVSVRCSASWKQLSGFKPKSEENPAAATQIKLKNSMSFGLGLTYTV